MYACQNGTDLRQCGCCAEDEILGAARAIKAINPNVTTIAYLNSEIAYPWYRAAAPFAANPSGWQHVSESGNRTWKRFDFTKPGISGLWQEACLNMTRTGAIDACFVDGCLNKAKGLPPAQATKLAAAKAKMLRELQEWVTLERSRREGTSRPPA